jgi:predicted ATPase
MGTPLAATLHHYLAKRCWSCERLAEEAGLPRNTVYRWTHGEVKRVRHWQDLADAARALALTRSQTDALFAAGGHPAIEELLARVTDEEHRTLLARWASTSPNNLPAQVTSFVGREDEVARVAQVLATARLVTLTGPGGSGKTRLALEAARAVRDVFEEVRFVDLAAIRDPGLVIFAIAETLDLEESPNESPRRALETHLRNRSVLLVLDNVEQVIEAAPLVTELLAAAPGVKALVTSRARLNVRGEHELPVRPLALPYPATAFAELARNPAVALFVDRARAADHAFALTARNAPLVAELCARLDGLPLGIELAAARARQMPPGAMLERFPDRLALASAGPRDMPARQRTLRATIAWSYDLLRPNERALLDAMSVFAGGFTEEAAASVCAAIERAPFDVPAGLESLVEQNLLRQTWDGEGAPRYKMLETIREYALERLTERGTAETVAKAAVAYCLELSERAELEGNGQAHWLPRLIAEHDNFRAALDWCRRRGHVETGLRLCVGLMLMWHLRDHQMEARAWLEAFLEGDSDVSPGLRARALLWQGLLLMRGTGDDRPVTCYFDEALAVFRAEGDLNGVSETLQAEGDVYRNQGEMELARQRYAESLALAERAANGYLVAHGHMGLALCAQETGRIDDARRHWQMMLEWAERAGNRASMALALNSLGEMARHDGDWEAAERCYEQALRLATELGNDSRMALALHNLGYVALSRGEARRAKARFTQGLRLYDQSHHPRGVAECLAGLARAEATAGEPERAARLCGASEAILDRLGARLDTLDRADYERTLACLRSQLGEKLDDLLEEGRAMSMDRAVAYAVDTC